MHEAKTHLSRLVDMALEGDDVVITRRDRPVVRLTPIAESNRRRAVGALPGLLKKMPDDFNETLEDWNVSLVPEVVPAPKPRPRNRRK